MPARIRSFDVASGIVVLVGNHSSVSQVRVARVSHIQTVAITSVCFEGRAGVPPVGAVRRPGSALVGLNVCDDTNSGRCHRGAVAVEKTVDLGTS